MWGHWEPTDYDSKKNGNRIKQLVYFSLRKALLCNDSILICGAKTLTRKRPILTGVVFIYAHHAPYS